MRGRYQKIRENIKEEKRGRENLYGEVLGNHLNGIRVSPIGVSHCRISIHPQQQIDCEHSLVVSPLTELYTSQYIYIYIGLIIKVIIMKQTSHIKIMVYL